MARERPPPLDLHRPRHALPLGGPPASVVVAETEEAARELLRAALSADGLDPDEPYTLWEVSLEQPADVVLCNRE